MAYTSMATLLILLIVEHEITKQLCAYAFNFMLRPISAIKKVEYDSEVSDSDDGNSLDESIGDGVMGDGEEMFSSLRKTTSAKIRKQKVYLEMVSKYYGCRLAVDRITFNIKK